MQIVAGFLMTMVHSDRVPNESLPASYPTAITTSCTLVD